MPDPISSANLRVVTCHVRAFARQHPDAMVPLVAGRGPTVRSTSHAGEVLLANGWCPARSSLPAPLAATMANAAVRLEHTAIPAHLARWS